MARVRKVESLHNLGKLVVPQPVMGSVIANRMFELTAFVDDIRSWFYEIPFLSSAHLTTLPLSTPRRG